MTKKPVTRHLLGDLKAESDHAMLDLAFYQTPDCNTLTESSDKSIVVGRRGTGKSALAYHLESLFKETERAHTISYTFEESSIIGIGPSLEIFGDSFRLISAASKLLFRYAVIMEVFSDMPHGWKLANDEAFSIIEEHRRVWKSLGADHSDRLFALFDSRLRGSSDRPEIIVAKLSGSLNIKKIEKAFVGALAHLKRQVVMLIDKLDEGYEPDEKGVGLVSGLIDACTDLQNSSEYFRPIIFIRDNMFRRLANMNPDYSRNVEGYVLRLHWDEYTLKNMVASRLRIVFELKEENTRALWNKVVSPSLRNDDGFKKCLRMTLYRPRDLLILLNESFNNAYRYDREKIDTEDLLKAGKEISVSRLDDLVKEYSPTFPSLEKYVKGFTNLKPEMDLDTARLVISHSLDKLALDAVDAVEKNINYDPDEVIRALYSMGFLGLKKEQYNSFVFCHDGTECDRTIDPTSLLLVHPCFWMALNMPSEALGEDQAKDIHDEYAITVSNEPNEIRNRRLSGVIANLNMIPASSEAQGDFSEWVLSAARIAFAGRIHNPQIIEDSPKELCSLISAVNLAISDTWKILKESYGCGRILFAVSNSESLVLQRQIQAKTFG